MWKPKIKIPKFLEQIDYLKSLPWLLIILITVTLGFFVYFLYQNYFQTKNQLLKINQLNEKVSPVIVDIDTYNKIIANLDKKKDLMPINPQLINNPFINNN